MAPAPSARVAPTRVLLVACFGAFLAFLDATIVNVAFPSIRESFPTVSIGSLSWILNAYNIVFAAFLIVCGRLTDLLGRRRAFATGVALFTVASALCGAAPSLDLLIAARIVQALGAAMLVPASLALVVEAFPGSDAPTRSGSGVRRPPSPPASGRRSVVSSWSSAAGAGPSSSTSRSASSPSGRRAASSWRAGPPADG